MCNKKNIISELYQKYGRTFIVYHIFLSVNFYALFLYLLKRGVDMNYYLNKIGIKTEGYSQAASEYVAAYAVYKITLPARLSLTALTTPFVFKLIKRFRK
jgi:hypothetical protein